MQKGVAGQRIGVQMVSASDGSAFTGSVTVYVTGDAGSQAIGSVGSGTCTHEGNGYHSYAPAQSETNYDLIAFTFIGSGAVPVTVQVYTAINPVTAVPTAEANATAVRSELGLTGSLDSAFGDIPTVSEFNARTILAADYATAGQATAIETDTQDIQTRLPAALVSGRIDAYVGAMASNSVTAAALATDAVSEIQAGLATSTELVVVASYIDTEIAAIKARTDSLPNDPASASVIASAFTGVNTKLDAIDDYVDSEVAAIKTVTDKLNGMLVQDGLVWQYTANALELAASSSGTVYVLPTKGTQQDRRASTDEIRIYRTEGYTLVRTVTDATGANVDLSAKTLELIIEGENRNDKAVIPDVDIDVSGTGNATYTIEIPTTVSAKADKTYNFYLWDKTTSARPKLLDNGKFIITYAGTSGTT